MSFFFNYFSLLFSAQVNEVTINFRNDRITLLKSAEVLKKFDFFENYDSKVNFNLVNHDKETFLTIMNLSIIDDLSIEELFKCVNIISDLRFNSKNTFNDLYTSLYHKTMNYIKKKKFFPRDDVDNFDEESATPSEIIAQENCVLDCNSIIDSCILDTDSASSEFYNVKNIINSPDEVCYLLSAILDSRGLKLLVFKNKVFIFKKDSQPKNKIKNPNLHFRSLYLSEDVTDILISMEKDVFTILSLIFNVLEITHIQVDTIEPDLVDRLCLLQSINKITISPFVPSRLPDNINKLVNINTLEIWGDLCLDKIPLLPNLKHLNLTFKDVKHNQIKFVSNLESLDLSMPRFFNDDLVLVFMHKKLRSLKLSGVCDTSGKFDLKELPDLEFLDISNLSDINYDLQHLREDFKDDSNIDLRDDLKKDSRDNLLIKIPDVQTLIISKRIQFTPNLKKLMIVNPIKLNYSNESVVCYYESPDNLKDFTYDFYPNTDDRKDILLSGNIKMILTGLTLKNVTLNDKHPVALLQFSNIKHLEIDGMKNIMEYYRRLVKLKKLQSLTLVNSILQVDILNYIFRNLNIEYLKILDCIKLNKTIKFPNTLRYLELRDEFVTSEYSEEICRLPHLQKVTLTNCKIEILNFQNVVIQDYEINTTNLINDTVIL